MQKRIFFPDLDSIRFIAFMLVFLQHGFYNAFAALEGKNAFLDRLILFFFLGGRTGVQIFFVLSGFLITYLILSEIKENGKLNIGKFYARRTLRIWPLYFATVIFAFLLYPWVKTLMGINSDLCSKPWYYFLFLANFDVIRIAEECPGKDAMTQGIVWSVSIEEQFYLIWPLLFLIFRRAQTFIFFLVLVVCMIYRASIINDPGARLYFHTLSVMGDLAIGGLGAYLAANNKRFLSLLEQLPRNLTGICYVIIFLAYFYSDIIFRFPGAAIFNRWILDVFWLFIILEQSFANKSVFKLRKLHFFSTWGKYTYGLYMLHPVGILLIDILFRLMGVSDIGMTLLLIKGLLSFVCSLCLAYVSYHRFERPFLRVKEKMAIIKTQSAL